MASSTLCRTVAFLRQARRPLSWGALAVVIPGCLTMGSGEPTDDGGDETVAPGTYEVSSDQASSTCGAGSLALGATWTFEVVLKETDDGKGVSWDVGNGPSDGTLADDGESFTISSSFIVDMREGSENSYLPACSVKRTDLVQGKLPERDSESDALGSTFEGSMTFTFEATEGSDCSDLLVGEERLAAALPCTAKYDLEGTAKEAPEDDEEVSQ